ncbi:hypothetical protein [Chryseobacterium culicis]|uniref:hypothetical protein n=1 Tax=Chryseobacterium culicis TaxID=680127 RepID=UPI0018754651|nr:hypothetical protein [Chryseobacterium culicis]MBE4950878.1 hypothetical protein [Chryseobacterium culicis]
MQKKIIIKENSQDILLALKVLYSNQCLSSLEDVAEKLELYRKNDFVEIIADENKIMESKKMLDSLNISYDIE